MQGNTQLSATKKTTTTKNTERKTGCDFCRLMRRLTTERGWLILQLLSPHGPSWALLTVSNYQTHLKQQQRDEETRQTLIKMTNGITFFMYFFSCGNLPSCIDITLLSGNPTFVCVNIQQNIYDCKAGKELSCRQLCSNFLGNQSIEVNLYSASYKEWTESLDNWIM